MCYSTEYKRLTKGILSLFLLLFFSSNGSYLLYLYIYPFLFYTHIYVSVVYWYKQIYIRIHISYLVGSSGISNLGVSKNDPWGESHASC